jgi:hypothetical protein
MRTVRNSKQNYDEQYIEGMDDKSEQKALKRAVMTDRKHTRIEMSRYRGRVVASIDGLDI